ncbi:hypothetical protein SKAU_G00365040 [Synaphobranchus kaupii]|uniref:Uncharacterized protein n=1 Tax=Synaphobranchus kaupii TaxID=118154 RepID=A0A9Q1EEW9_SYNKA|nr:hypothetical protein SKAU_G00365040 [Synaphobranchus kaupii]
MKVGQVLCSSVQAWALLGSGPSPKVFRVSGLWPDCPWKSSSSLMDSCSQAHHCAPIKLKFHSDFSVTLCSPSGFGLGL